MSGMQCLMGVRTDKFVLLVGDRSDFLMGAIVLKTDGSKAYKLGEKTMMLCYGEGGDPVQFSEFIEKNLKLYQMRNSYELSPKSAAHYIRRNLANSLRSRDSYLVFLLLGGFDEETGGGYLTTMDYLGNQFEANYLAQWELKGFGGRFSASIMDSLYKPDMTLEEATAAVKKCISDVKKRCAIALPEFEAFVIDADGTRNVGPIRAEKREEAVVSKREEYLDWSDYFMAVACLSAQRSKDPNTQVGACIVSPDKKIVGIGYNGMPTGCHDDKLPWGKTSSDPLLQKYTFVCHAEMNAIMNKISADLKGCSIYVALFPCNECAKLIIQSGIRHVVYMTDKPDKAEMKASKIMFDMVGIKYELVEFYFEK